MTMTSPGFAGEFAATSVPSACVTTALQPKLTITFVGSTCFGGNASQVFRTCRLSVTGSIVNALLVDPFAVITTSVTPGRKFVGNLNGDGGYKAVRRYGWRRWHSAVAARVQLLNRQQRSRKGLLWR